MNEIAFLNSFIVSWFLIHRKATDFYMWTYPATLKKVFLRWKSFLVESLGPLNYKTISSANRDHLTSSFLICIHFISDSCLVGLDRSWSAILDNSRASGHPYLIPVLKGNGFRFFPLIIMLAIGLSATACIRLRYIPSIHSFFSFYHVWVLNSMKRFHYIDLDDNVTFALILFMCSIIFADLCIIIMKWS
jgi:hypothetical protein